ncbi:GAF and ANTAR domain-containing protein [Nocardia sp. NBC_00565]|uniref:GAF and ANTAR domain-containing protein n=1 Tax=Nocardia sp. NBC_00565 TaxID=2975993 RepID=UPI002E80AE38|nr:GAF and ANTAR domain-containing protein [Nocardia sp. NBC_00565]WUC05222.1 GAF and ANTAR domain-containing protein [Nocardia sp. NBC_00565]
MSDNEVLVVAAARLAELLPVLGNTSEMVRQLMHSAITALDLAGCTVMLMPDETLTPDEQSRFAAADPEEFVDIELCQHSSARGPSMDVFRTGEPIAVDEIGRRRDRWPEFSAEAVRHGVSSLAEIPMRVGSTTVGALGLYGPAPRAWTDSDLSVGGLLASMATGHILNAHVLRRQQRVTEQLQHALDARIVVEQAKGVIANARRTTPEAAYELIRQHARKNRVAVQAVAKGVVELGLRI